MGKRSDGFDRRKRDFYPTPEAAVRPLRPHLPAGPFTYAEPCAGDLALVRALDKGVCGFASDIMPDHPDIVEKEFMKVTRHDVRSCSMIITNPPWDFPLIEELIGRARNIWKLPIWLLLTADFAHNKQSAPLLSYCERIVSIGRVKWIPDSPHAGKDNCAWYLFNPLPVTQTAFHGRI